MPWAQLLNFLNWSVHWAWIERASWLVAIVGIPLGIGIAYVQLRELRKEQTRILKELSLKPDVEVGFGMPETTKRGDPILNKEATVGFPGEGVNFVTFTAINAGERTARNVLLNFIFPSNVQVVELIPPQRDGDHNFIVRESAGDLHPTHFPQVSQQISVHVPASG